MLFEKTGMFTYQNATGGDCRQGNSLLDVNFDISCRPVSVCIMITIPMWLFSVAELLRWK